MPRKKKKEEEEVVELVEDEIVLSAEGSDLPEETPVSEEEAIEYAKGVAAELSESQKERKAKLEGALLDLKELQAKLSEEYGELRGAEDVGVKVAHMISLAEQELAPLV